MSPAKKTNKPAPKAKVKTKAKAKAVARKSPAGSKVQSRTPRRSEVITPAKAPTLVAAPVVKQQPAPVPVAPPIRASQEGRYVYGIIESSSPETFGKSGIGGAGEVVYTVHHGDVAAVVSRTSVFIFDPTRENALA
ncbi:MAG: GvpL/GvpF family gas vesicle protein, partial [Terriglobales bacterium]